MPSCPRSGTRLQFGNDIAQRLVHPLAQPRLAQLAAGIGDTPEDELDHVVVARLLEIGGHHLSGEVRGRLPPEFHNLVRAHHPDPTVPPDSPLQSIPAVRPALGLSRPLPPVETPMSGPPSQRLVRG